MAASVGARLSFMAGAYSAASGIRGAPARNASRRAIDSGATLLTEASLRWP